MTRHLPAHRSACRATGSIRRSLPNAGADPAERKSAERLPNLRLIASTGPINAAIDVKAAGERKIEIAHTSYASSPSAELTWALILASRRHVVEEVESVRSGGWQRKVGADLHGRTLGLLGLGNSAVARVGSAFGMRVISWSENLTPEKAKAVGATAVARFQCRYVRSTPPPPPSLPALTARQLKLQALRAPCLSAASSETKQTAQRRLV